MISFGELVNGLTIINLPTEKKKQVDISLTMSKAPEEKTSRYLTAFKYVTIDNVKYVINTSVCPPIDH